MRYSNKNSMCKINIILFAVWAIAVIFPSNCFAQENNINIMVDSPLPYSMKMYDTKGNIFLQWDYLTVEKLVVNTNNLNSGVYYLGVQSGAKFVTKKIVIQ